GRRAGRRGPAPRPERRDRAVARRAVPGRLAEPRGRAGAQAHERRDARGDAVAERHRDAPNGLRDDDRGAALGARRRHQQAQPEARAAARGRQRRARVARVRPRVGPARRDVDRAQSEDAARGGRSRADLRRDLALQVLAVAGRGARRLTLPSTRFTVERSACFALVMLVTFRTKAYANITMFGDVAKTL